jgi:diguanylate cyclase (GGDEF)-like protein/PAS domain S-box-containing protein
VPRPTSAGGDVTADGADRRETTEIDPDVEPVAGMYRAIAETAVNPFAVIDDQGVFRWVGRSIEELLGWRPEELIGRSIDAIVAPDSLDEVLEAFAQLEHVPGRPRYPRGGVGQPADLLCRDGSVTHCNLVAATKSQTGLPYHVVFARRAGYERALDLALEAIASHAGLCEVLAALVDTLQQSIPGCRVAIGVGWQDGAFSMTAGDGAALLVDEPEAPWRRALESGEDVVVRRLEDMSPGLASRARAEGLASCWVHPVTVPGDDAPTAAMVMLRPQDGIPTRFTWLAVHRTGRLLRFTLQWDRSHRALEYAATHDVLTGLANRSAFASRLREIAKRAEGEASVLFVDLDRFKPVNDRLGHLVGDRVLQAVAQRLSGAVRPGDLVARIGGDEFAVLCERLGRREAAGVAERLVAALQDPILVDGVPGIGVTASIGVTTVATGDDPETVLGRADQAMRRVKASGRGGWVFDPGAP